MKIWIDGNKFRSKLVGACLAKFDNRWGSIFLETAHVLGLITKLTPARQIKQLAELITKNLMVMYDIEELNVLGQSLEQIW